MYARVCVYDKYINIYVYTPTHTYECVCASVSMHSHLFGETAVCLFDQYIYTHTLKIHRVYMYLGMYTCTSFARRR